MKKKKSQNSVYSWAAKPATELVLVALAFALQDVYCTLGSPGKLPLGGIQASTREAALYTGRSLRCGVRRFGLKFSAIHQEIQCYPSRAPEFQSHHVTCFGLSVFACKMGIMIYFIRWLWQTSEAAFGTALQTARPCQCWTVSFLSRKRLLSPCLLYTVFSTLPGGTWKRSSKDFYVDRIWSARIVFDALGTQP